MGIFWGYSNYITSDLTPRKESIMSADQNREALLARTVDTHVCTHNVALGASGTHPTLYVEQPRLLAVLTYWTGNRHHRAVDSDSIRQEFQTIMELCSSVPNTHRFIDSTYFPSTIITSTTTSSKESVPSRSSPTKICHAFLITKQFHDTRILDQLSSIKKVYYGTRKFFIIKTPLDLTHSYLNPVHNFARFLSTPIQTVFTYAPNYLFQ